MININCSLVRQNWSSLCTKSISQDEINLCARQNRQMVSCVSVARYLWNRHTILIVFHLKYWCALLLINGVHLKQREMSRVANLHYMVGLVERAWLPVFQINIMQMYCMYCMYCKWSHKDDGNAGRGGLYNVIHSIISERNVGSERRVNSRAAGRG